MRLWQQVDSNGKLHYSLVPALDDATKSEENPTAFAPLSSIKTEENDDHPIAQKSSGCDVNRYMGSMVHLCEVAIECYTCDKCGMKFPVESMMNRHKASHNLRSWLRRKHLTVKSARRLRIRSKRHGKQTLPRKQTGKHEYACSSCDFGCNRRATLTMHMRKKHKSDEPKTSARSLSCTICGCKCKNQACLNRHMWEHRNVNTTHFACDKCSFECKRSSVLVTHIVQNHQKTEVCEDNLPSKKCKATKCNYRSLEKNDSQDCTDETKKATTTSSPADFEYPSKEEASLVARTSKKQVKKAIEEQCNLCGFKCSTKSSLYSHKRQHRVENVSEVYACNECGFKTSKKSSLYSHIKRKHKVARSCTGEEQPELFYCNQCDYKNKNKYELKVHVARKHTDDFKFSCETCGKKFKVKGDLTNHIRFSHREQPVICDVCGKTCLNSNSLYVHQKFAHYKAKYECQVCKRRMVSQENLNEHMLRQHERRENVVCEECGKTFSRNSRLKVHMRIHTGDKPYTCTICNKSFARRTALKQHLLIHTGIRPYVCDICGKAFTQKPGLISHRKSHPGSHPPLPRVLIDHILNDVMNN